MKTKINVPLVRIFWIIAFTAVAVFTMTATTCGKGGGGGSTEGQLTITNMNDYIGCYIAAWGSYPPVTAATSVNVVGNSSTASPTKITGSTVSLNVWVHRGDGYVAYTGNDDQAAMLIILFNPDQGGKSINLGVDALTIAKNVGSALVVFTNGSATLHGNDINWND